MTNPEEYRDVWVLAEQTGGTVHNVTLELLGKGRELADALESSLVAVLPGDNAGERCRRLIEYGADKVISIDDPQLARYQTGTYTEAIARAIRQFKPEIFLIGATFLGRDLAPRLAGRVATGLTADCTGLETDRETRRLVQTKPTFGGHVMAAIVTPQHRPQMATVRPGVMTARRRDETRQGEVIEFPAAIAPESVMVKILETAGESRRRLNLAEAEIIVAGGRGVGSPEQFKVIEELAAALGAGMGATRDVTDAGWIADTHLIGQTGQTVRPRLYLACGISGAGQHIAGMKDSETIVAINTDPKAPIFQIADYGLVADLHQIVPRLTAAVRQTRTGR